MADLEFFLDPVCPWCWITSRWVKEVQQLRDYDVAWRFISLQFVNENRTSAWYTEEYRAGHRAGTNGLRVAAAIREQHGNDSVDAFFGALGTEIHNGGRQDDFRLRNAEVIAEALAAVDLPASLLDAREDPVHDALLREETELAFSRAGREVGTPIITFRPGHPDEASLFGPVIAKIPRGEHTLKTWDAIEYLATTSQVAELKRSNRARPQFD